MKRIFADDGREGWAAKCGRVPLQRQFHQPRPPCAAGRSTISRPTPIWSLRGAIRPGDAVNFAVPTGNFGDILAGEFARRMGLPVGRLICASNANNVLTDFIRTGVYDRRRDVP